MGIIGAMISEPEVLILDEPFNFLDPSSQIILMKLLSEYHKNNTKTIILSSHNLNHVSDLCSRIAIMERGKIIMDKVNTNGIIEEIKSYFQM